MAAERKLKILELARSKHTLRQIATTVGCAHSYVSRVIRKYLQEVNALQVTTTELMITEMHEDYNAVLRAHLPNIADPKHASIILQALAQIAKLRGLNAAERVEVTNTLPATIEYIIDAEVVRDAE